MISDSRDRISNKGTAVRAVGRVVAFEVAVGGAEKFQEKMVQCERCRFLLLKKKKINYEFV